MPLDTPPSSLTGNCKSTWDWSGFAIGPDQNLPCLKIHCKGLTDPTVQQAQPGIELHMHLNTV